MRKDKLKNSKLKISNYIDLYIKKIKGTFKVI